MKIQITETCECMYQTRKMNEPEDCRLEKGTILEGKTTPGANWCGVPTDDTDIENTDYIYWGIPNKCFTVVDFDPCSIF